MKHFLPQNVNFHLNIIGHLSGFNVLTGPILAYIQYIPRNMHTVFALLCFVVVIHWLIFPYPSGLLHWHCGNLTIAPVPAKQPWWIWINTSCEFIMNDCIATTKQSTTKPCAYFLGYTVWDPNYITTVLTDDLVLDCVCPSASTIVTPLLYRFSTNFCCLLVVLIHFFVPMTPFKMADELSRCRSAFREFRLGKALF